MAKIVSGQGSFFDLQGCAWACLDSRCGGLCLVAVNSTSGKLYKDWQTPPSLGLVFLCFVRQSSNKKANTFLFSFFPSLSLCRFLISFVVVLSALPFIALIHHHRHTPKRTHSPRHYTHFPPRDRLSLHSKVLEFLFFFFPTRPFFSQPRQLGREGIPIPQKLPPRAARPLESRSTPSTSRFAPPIAPRAAPGSHSARRHPFPQWRHLQLSGPWASPLPSCGPCNSSGSSSSSA